MIHHALEEVSKNFLAAKVQPFAGHPLGTFLRNTAPAEIRDALPGQNLTFAGSSGSMGRWTHVPWIGIYDPAVTTGAQHGYYLVYLFSTDMSRVYLSMNQGTTEVVHEFGQNRTALEELRRRSALMRDRVPEQRDRLRVAEIDLGGSTYFPRGYEAGHAFGTVYQTDSIPPETELAADLHEGLRLYRLLLGRGGVSAISSDNAEDDHDAGNSLTERRRYVVHRNIERNSAAGRRAKSMHGYVCQACEFDFEAVYGELGHQYIEAHHLTPLASLPEDIEVPVDPKTDFAVLCSNCHRMVHRPRRLLSIAELQVLIRSNREHQNGS
jgi:5-methylcytosine-specific restriction protein A